jgi:hypothetical protein
VSGEFDLAQTSNSLDGDAVLAMYNFRTKRITVRGASLDDATKPTLVHELTHALQDQHFDLQRLHVVLDDDQLDGLDAIVEGDAERIKYRYEDEFGAEDTKEADQTADAASEGSVYDNYPPALVAMYTASYSLGQLLVEILEKYGDPDAIDDAIMDPPHSSEFMLSPFEYLDGHDPVAVPAPKLAGGEVSFDEDTFGPLALFLMLEQRLGAKAALAATDAWGGDHYVAFERDQKVCVRLDVRGDTPAAQEGILAALGAWRDTMPGGSVTVTKGDYARVEACDPGVTAALPPSPDAAYDPVLLPWVRSEIVLEVAEAKRPEAFARCVSQAFIDLAPMSFLAADSPEPAQTDTLVAAASAKCQ